MSHDCFFAAIVVSLGVSPWLAQASDDWPVFRGDGPQTGVAASRELPAELSVRWTFQADNTFHGGPVICGDVVYVAALNGKLHALDLSTGARKWVYQAGDIRTTPAVRNGAVYIGDLNGKFHCVDAATGAKRWIVSADDDIIAPANFYQDKVLFGSDDYYLYCVHPNGKVAWWVKTKEKVRSAPAVVGDHILLAGCDRTLHVIDARTGKQVSSTPLHGHVGASAAAHEHWAYVGNMDNKFLAVDWKKSAILWQFEAKRGPQAFLSSPALTDELVVVGSRDKKVRALNRQTGKEVWVFSTMGRVDSSPAIIGNRVAVGSQDGNLYILNLANGAEVARFALGPISSSPAVSRQFVVVAAETGEITCLGPKK